MSTAATLPPRLESLGQYLRWHAAQAPAREAVVGEGERLGYAQLARSTEAVARELRRMGLVRGERLAMMGTPGPGFLVLLLACQELGVVWLGLNPAYSVRELSFVLRDALPRGVCIGAGVPAEAAERLREAAALVGMRSTPIALAPGAGGAVAALHAQGVLPRWAGSDHVPPDDAAIIVYTSGTTGQPKGALVSGRGLAENGWWLARRCGFAPGRTLVTLPINHIGCVGDLCATSLVLGSTLVFEPRFDAARAAARLREERITWLGLVPAQYQMLQAEGGLTRESLSSVRQLAWGGAAMPRPLIEHLQAQGPDLFNSYGLTECSGTVTITPPGATVEALANTVGLPVTEGVLRVDAASGEPGEVQVRGPHVFLGYLGREDATRAAFTPDGWLRTGDIGRLGPDGLELVGRTHERFKSGGYNVDPREVEVVVEATAGVELCAVVAMPDPLWGEVGVAFVQGPADRLDVAALERHCRERLANYKVPKRFFVRPQLPLLPVGKVDKHALRDSLAGPSSPPSLQEPSP
jgi:acyl-CoA synthetase (AMP-forming)/AMP-acid ligase II